MICSHLGIEPEFFLELEEYLCVRAHSHCVDRLPLPLWVIQVVSEKI